MLENTSTSVQEYINDVNEGNTTKYMENNCKTEDIHVTLQSTSEKTPHAVPVKGNDRYQYFQSTRTKPGSQRAALSSSDSNGQKEKNYSVAYLDKGLVKIPPQALEKKNIITLLDLSRNKFEYFALEIIQITNLRVLRLDHNKIKCLPGEIFKLSKLEVLSLGYNSLQTLPTNFNKLVNLRELNLQNNLLETFSEELTGLKDLKTLNLLQNKLVHFSTTFRQMTGLTELHFEWFKYCNPPLTQHQKGIEGGKNIARLRELCELRKKDKGISFFDFIESFSTNPINLEEIDDQDRTLLHIASTFDDVSVIRYIISNLPSLIDKLDADHNTAFCTSIIKDNQYAARYLLKHGANPTKGGGIYGSALHIAVKKLNTTIVNDILTLGENPNKIDADGNTPLHLAILAMAEGHVKAQSILGMLLEQGSNPNARNRENWAPLHLAARKRDARTVRWIVSYNLEMSEIHGRDDVFKINKKGGAYKWTAMHIAAYASSPELV
jgi:hypothetical protein